MQQILSNPVIVGVFVTGIFSVLAVVWGTITAREKYRAEVENKRLEAKKVKAQTEQIYNSMARAMLDERNEEIEVLRQQLKEFKVELKKANLTLDSVMEDARTHRAAVMKLQKQNEAQQMQLSELSDKLKERDRGIEILTRQIIERHDSSPTWRPEGD